MLAALTIVTVIYAAVLVIAIGAALAAIAYYLNGARADLASVAASLREADRNVSPLGHAVKAVNDGLAGALGNLKSVREALAAVEAKLGVAR